MVDAGCLQGITPSSTHLVLIPSYNPGVKLEDTLRAARAQWAPVWVVQFSWLEVTSAQFTSDDVCLMLE